MNHLESTHALTARLIQKYPRHGFYLRPYKAGEEVQFAVVFIYDGEEIWDPNLSPWALGSAEPYGFYGLDPEDCDSLSAHNQGFANRFAAEIPGAAANVHELLEERGDGLRVTQTTVAELVDFCEADEMWRPRGRKHGEHFWLDAVSRSWRIEVLQAPEPDTLGSLVTENAAITLKVNGEVVHLTWGEATELINAMVLIASVGMFG